MNRRALLRLAGMAGAALLVGRPSPSGARMPDAPLALGIPGPYPGRVVEVRSEFAVRGGEVDAAAVEAMVRRGMCALTRAPDPTAAWRRFFEPGDVVGLKVNPVAGQRAITSFALVQAVVSGLRSAGVRPADVVVFDRYRSQFVAAGYPEHLPDGVRWDAACAEYDGVQLDIGGYDRDVFREIDLVSPDCQNDERARRSHVSLIVARQVNKVINLPVLKDHKAAGVTLALKNLSHGLVNNVRRSHAGPAHNDCATFIPAIVSLPVIRSKVVLHVLDGTQAVFDGGPTARPETTWAHKTLYFATDPVAMDRVGWDAVDAKRRAMGLIPVAAARFDESAPGAAVNASLPFRQPQHIELAAAAGLGVVEREHLQHERIALP
jgi:uncharacterized protein (DUF362 family)